eukprot:1880098-Amphidinium_carterae.1
MEGFDVGECDDDNDRRTTATSGASTTRGKGQGKMTKGYHRPRETNERRTLIHYHGNCYNTTTPHAEYGQQDKLFKTTQTIYTLTSSTTLMSTYLTTM